MVEFYQSKIPFARIHLQRRSMLFPGGGWLQFKTSEEPDALRGESIDFAVVDEAAHVPNLREIWELCLRPTLMDRRGEAWFISTPSGFNYFNELHLRHDGYTWHSFHYPSTANPYLDPKELAELAKDMPALVKRQEIDAEFVQLAGALFQRDWIRYLDDEPAAHWVRSWDLAFTEKTTSDFTAGAKIGMTQDGTVVVADMIHGRWDWPKAIRVVSETAKADGPLVRQGIEVVGAQVGFIQTLQRDPELAATTLTPIEVTRDKLTRSLPLMARAEQGKLAFVRGPWNKALLDELSAFDGSGKGHDDQVDALSGGLTMLSSPTGVITSMSGIYVGSNETRQFTPRQFTPRMP